jgi:hypothetical protein
MKYFFLLLFTFIISVTTKPREVDILEDFNLDLEYSLGRIFSYLEKTGNDSWNKRGVISFQQKGSNKNYRSLTKIANNELSIEELKQIEKECEYKGLYTIRVSKGKGYLLSSIPAVTSSINISVIWLKVV